MAIDVAPFAVRDCALLTRATHLNARNLRELSQGLAAASLASVYQHFWGRFLRPQFDEPEYNNDFAAWVQRALNEKALAERMGAVNPADFDSLADVRDELTELIEIHLNDNDWEAVARPDSAFMFLESVLIVFDTGLRLNTPADMMARLPLLSAGCIYYHFIDARRRTAGRTDDFSAWISQWGEEYHGLRDALRRIDPYFWPLRKLRDELGQALSRAGGKEAA